MVRQLAAFAGKSEVAIDSARRIALSTLRFTALSPNPEIAAAAAWLAIVNEIENEIPGFKRLLLEALVEDAKA
jgi:hypothetical protein